eukprot:GHVQ01038972.1.p1 GENE.GHVQ01038972.1~~GHVQ01038972.1.p1  ORF type:complete len:173 (-),score=33.87 GHVQ01038972.1:83-601(-)
MYRWTDNDRNKYKRVTGTADRFTPKWSEPCKVMEVKGCGGCQLVVRSLWFEGRGRKLVSVSDCVKLEKQHDGTPLQQWKYEMLTELARHAGRSRAFPMQEAFFEGLKEDEKEKLKKRWEELQGQMQQEDVEDALCLTGYIRGESAEALSSKRVRREFTQEATQEEKDNPDAG